MSDDSLLSRVEARISAEKSNIAAFVKDERRTASMTGVSKRENPPPLVNPFMYLENINNVYEIVKTILLGITLFPIRMMGSIFFFALAALFAKISVIGHDMNEPMGAWRRVFFQLPMAFCARMIIFFCGVYWIETKGKRSKLSEAIAVVGAPHSTCIDAMIMMYLYNIPSAIGKVENLEVPLMGPIVKATQSVLVDRKDKANKEKAMNDIAAFLSHPKQKRHFVVFPEGTCTNRSVLINFKKGAFQPGKPVQPVAFQWPHYFFDPAWTSAGPNRILMVCRMMCQVFNRVQVTFMEPYVPNEEEKADAQLFADNVREKMAKVLGDLDVSDHSYGDMFLAKAAKKRGVHLSNMKFALFVVCKKLPFFKERSAGEVLRRFTSVMKGKKKVMFTSKAFAKAMRLPHLPAVVDLYNLVKVDDEGVDFLQLILGISLLEREFETEGQGELFTRMLFDQKQAGVAKAIMDLVKKSAKRAEVTDSFENLFGFFKSSPEMFYVCLNLFHHPGGEERLKPC